MLLAARYSQKPHWLISAGPWHVEVTGAEGCKNWKTIFYFFIFYETTHFGEYLEVLDVNLRI